MSSAEVVPIRQAQNAVEVWTRQQRALLRQHVAVDLDDSELDYFFQVCVHRGLDPFKGHIIATKRWDSRKGKEVVVIQETIRGYRVIADRTGEYAGQDEAEWCDANGRWTDVWLDPKKAPTAARVRVYRHGHLKPATGKVHYVEYVQLSKGHPTGRWKLPPEGAPADQLAKCAEAQAFRKGFTEYFREQREMPPQSRVSMEARAAGLDDDGRHALVAEVTNGRTSSTKELTEEELYDVRVAVSMAQTESDETPDADPATGEIVEEGPPWSERERQRLLAEIRGKAQTLSEAQWAKTYQALQKAGLGGEPDEMDIDELQAVDKMLTRNPKSFASSTLPKDPPMSERPPQENGRLEAPSSPEPPDAGDSSQEEMAGNPAPHGRNPSPSSWERQIAEATAEYPLIDVNAIVWGCLGRKVALDDITKDEERKAVLKAFKDYATGDVELDFDEDGVPRLTESPF